MAAVVAQLVAERKSFSVKERTHAANESGKKYLLSATDHLLCQMTVDEAGTNGIGHNRKHEVALAPTTGCRPSATTHALAAPDGAARVFDLRALAVAAAIYFEA